MYTFPLIQFYLGMIVGGAGRMLVTNIGKVEARILAGVSLVVLMLPDASMALYQLSARLPEDFNFWNQWFLGMTPFAVPEAAFFLVAYVAFGECPALRSLLNHRGIKLLGAISFSLYLVHLPVVELMSAVLGHFGFHNRILRLTLGAVFVVPPVLVLAYINWRAVEKPSNTFGRMLAAKLSKFFGVASSSAASPVAAE